MSLRPLLWIVEDDAEAILIYRQILDLRYRIVFFSHLSTFKEALHSLIETGAPHPRLIIADLRLADGNFLDFLAEEEGGLLLKAPFIVVSSYDDLDILRECFDEGALDYLTKPYTRNELIVKIERILNQVTPSWVMGPTKKGSENSNFLSKLTPREIQIFSVLYRSLGQPISKKTLIREVWKDTSVTPKALAVHMYNLRRKLIPFSMEVSYLFPNSYCLNLKQLGGQASRAREIPVFYPES